MQFSSCSCYSSLLDPTIFFSILFLNTLHVCRYLNIRDQISQRRDTAEKSLVLIALLVTHAHYEGYTKDSGPNGIGRACNLFCS
jgi:hypothetical protein